MLKEKEKSKNEITELKSERELYINRMNEEKLELLSKHEQLENEIKILNQNFFRKIMEI